jgi:hypothetical protein
MREHRNPQKILPKQPTPDNQRTAPPEPPPEPEPEPEEVDHLAYALCDNLRRADAFITIAERQIEENWHDDDGDEEDSDEDRKMRHRMRIEYLVEAGKDAVRAGLYVAQQLEAALTARRRRA